MAPAVGRLAGTLFNISPPRREALSSTIVRWMVVSRISRAIMFSDLIRPMPIGVSRDHVIVCYGFGGMGTLGRGLNSCCLALFSCGVCPRLAAQPRYRRVSRHLHIPRMVPKKQNRYKNKALQQINNKKQS